MPFLPPNQQRQSIDTAHANMPVVRLSVPSIGSSSGVRAGLLLSAPREGDVDRQQAPVLAVAGSVVLTAKGRS